MVLVEIRGIGVIIIYVVALATMGALATFFVYLSCHKREFWELIYETNNKNYDKRL